MRKLFINWVLRKSQYIFCKLHSHRVANVSDGCKCTGRIYASSFFHACTKNGSSRCLRDVIIFLWIYIYIWRACVRFQTERETLACRPSERPKFVFLKRHTMPLQNLKYKRFAALTQSPSNEPGSSLCPFFLFQCVFIVRGMVPASFPSKFSLSLYAVFFRLFLACSHTDPKWVERTQCCYYNTATSSQSLVVEIRPSFNILRSVSMR